MERSGGVFLLLYAIVLCTVQSKSIREDIATPARPADFPVSLEYPLDLTFIMDTTGSMSSYIDSAKENIRKIVDAIVRGSKSKVRLALVEYRDHPPQDRSFVTRTHDFTESVLTMKSWLDNAKARGGGDAPEAVADALNEGTKLSWNAESTKIGIMISDAPPHSLDPSRDTSFHKGCPDEHDPMQLVREFAKSGVILYTVGVEPSIDKYKDFFEALAYITGGQYVPMRDPHQLINVIIGGAQEELSLKEFTSEVRKEFEKVTANGEEVDENQIALTVYQALNARGATSEHLTKNNKTLKGPSSTAKSLAELNSMADVRKKLGKGRNIPRRKVRGRLRSKMRGRRRKGRILRRKYGKTSKSRVHFRHKKRERLHGKSHDKELGYFPHTETRKAFSESSRFSKLSAYHPKGSKETFSIVKSGVSLDQITRLVKKETSRLK